jgi:hypothetical protein
LVHEVQDEGTSVAEEQASLPASFSEEAGATAAAGSVEASDEARHVGQVVGAFQT